MNILCMENTLHFHTEDKFHQLKNYSCLGVAIDGLLQGKVF
jgi:hypothetical protein